MAMQPHFDLQVKPNFVFLWYNSSFFFGFPDQNHILISFNFQSIHVIFLLRENSEIENGESKMMDLMTSGDIMANKKIRHHVEQAEGYILNAKQFRNVLSQRKPRGGVASSPPPLYVRGMSLLLRPRVNKARTRYLTISTRLLISEPIKVYARGFALKQGYTKIELEDVI